MSWSTVAWSQTYQLVKITTELSHIQFAWPVFHNVCWLATIIFWPFNSLLSEPCNIIFFFFPPVVETSPTSLCIMWNLGVTSAIDQHNSYAIYCLIYICKPNAGQISHAKYIHKTFIKASFVANWTHRCSWRSGTGHKPLLQTSREPARSVGCVVLRCLELLSCKTGTDCPASHQDPFQHPKQAGPGEHSGSSLLPVTRNFLQLLSVHVWVGFSASVLLDTDVY